MNRDYWTRPVQGSRSSYDYGNTRLQSDNRIPPLWWSLGVIVFSIGWWVLS